MCTINLKAVALIWLLSSFGASGQNLHDQNMIMSSNVNALMLNHSENGMQFSAFSAPAEREWSFNIMSDEGGDLLYYTNGCQIFNADHSVMKGGDTLNSGLWYDLWCHDTYYPDHEYGFYPNGLQSIVSVPRPNSPDQYYIIHRPAAEPDDDWRWNRGLYTTIDMYADKDGAAVIDGPKPFYDERDVGMNKQLTVTRHANGEDWWLIDQYWDSLAFDIYLVDSTGIAFRRHQLLTADITEPLYTGHGQTTFNHMGDLMVHAIGQVGTMLYDFDRVNGELAFRDRLPLPPSIMPFQPDQVFAGAAVSPNNRYLYVNYNYKLFQYDLESNDVLGSQLLIGDVEGRPLVHYNLTTLTKLSLGPDCKIYGTGGSGAEIHVVHQPNELGAACQFEPGAITLPHDFFRNEIVFPNYRLGPVGDEGSPCVDIYTSTEEEIGNKLPWTFTLSPLPAGGDVTANWAAPAGGRGEMTLELFDAAGKRLRFYEVPELVTQLTIPRKNLPSGYYTWRATSEGRIVGAGKLVWQ